MIAAGRVSYGHCRTRPLLPSPASGRGMFPRRNQSNGRGMIRRRRQVAGGPERSIAARPGGGRSLTPPEPVGLRTGKRRGPFPPRRLGGVRPRPRLAVGLMVLRPASRRRPSTPTKGAVCPPLRAGRSCGRAGKAGPREGSSTFHPGRDPASWLAWAHGRHRAIRNPRDRAPLERLALGPSIPFPAPLRLRGSPDRAGARRHNAFAYVNYS